MGCIVITKNQIPDLRVISAVTSIPHQMSLHLSTEKINLLRFRPNLRTIAEAKSYLECSSSFEQFKKISKEVETDPIIETEKK